MLHQIIEHARSKNLDVEPGFTPKFVKWAIQCDSRGRFLGLLPLAGKKEKGREFSKCPNMTQPEMKAGGITKSHFLVESLSIIAGVPAKDDEKENTKVAEKHLYFGQSLTDAAVHVPCLAGAAAFLNDSDSLAILRADVLREKAALTDLATFFIDGSYPVSGTEWHDWWRDRRTQRQAGPKPKSVSAGTVRCFVTGDIIAAAPTHEKIKGLTDVGGLAMGDTLIGFKQEAFCSFGFEQSANAALSIESAKAYVSGLNDLILRQSAKLAVTKTVFWFKKPVPQQDDPFEWLRQGDDTAEGSALARYQGLLSAIREGNRPNLGGNEYRVMEISSNGGRVVVRSWFEGSYSTLLANTLKWFDDLSVIHPRTGTQAPQPKFFAVLAATVRDPKEIAAPIEVAVWRCALLNLPIPDVVLSKVVMRVRALVTSGDSITFVQAGLLKAFHLRRNQIIDMVMNPEGPVPYQCGRLLAVLSELQRAALGDVGAGVVERFYPAFSSTPALVLGRLVLNAQNHLQKVRGDKPGLAHWFDEQMQSVISAIPVSDLPTTLSLEQQSLFALGFYQQKAARKKDDK